MKTKILPFLIFTQIVLFSNCNKNNDAASLNNNNTTPSNNDTVHLPISVSPFAGTYKGSIIDTAMLLPNTIPPNYIIYPIQTDYVIEINSTAVAGQVTITNCPIKTDTATISGNIFTISEKITVDINANNKTVQFASGLFSGANNDTLTAVFNSNQTKATNGSSGSIYKRTCLFIKQ